MDVVLTLRKLDGRETKALVQRTANDMDEEKSK